MNEIRRNLKFENERDSKKIIEAEWLVTNGLGGYASLSVGGAPTRKYHGVLVSALPAPLGRTVMFNYLHDAIQIEDKPAVSLSILEKVNGRIESPQGILKEFIMEDGLPKWIYELDGHIIEKRIFLIHMQNTVAIQYRLLKGDKKVKLIFEPYFQFRHHEDAVTQAEENPELLVKGNSYEISVFGLPSLKIKCDEKTTFTHERKYINDVFYRIEEERVYDSLGSLESIGAFQTTLPMDDCACFIASTESEEILKAISADPLKNEIERRSELVEKAKKTSPEINSDNYPLELIFAADQFIIIPSARVADLTWTHAIGIEAKTVIAGYHWFNDWGRDTMISLEGLTLVTGRFQDSYNILRTFCHHLKDGLLPNMFPDGQNEGIYNTADATLWLFHALERYVAYTNDESIIQLLLPQLKGVIDHHIQGTRFGIKVDPEDGLLNQGMENYALTWMDAKVGNLVVTPRRGKAVEINALWFNALSQFLEWYKKYGPQEESLLDYEDLLEKCHHSFNEKFWDPRNGYLYDVIEGPQGNDDSLRPNQILSISLKFPVLDREHWQPVIETVRKELLTPLGLRTLDPEDPNYKIVYTGNLFLRDSAYHQGTVWAWLIGPFVDAWLKSNPDDLTLPFQIVKGFEMHLNEGCIGNVNEIFDAGDPFIHRGCCAQAWSVAEILRIWVKIHRLKM